MVSSSPLRTVVASEQSIFLQGLQTLLVSTPCVQLVGAAHGPLEMQQLCQMSTPDLVVLDLNRLPGTWLDTIRLARATYDRMRILLLLEEQDEAWAAEQFAPGSVYSVSRDVSDDEFKAALAQVCANAAARLPVSAMNFTHVASPQSAEGTTLAAQARREEIMERELVMAGRIQADILPEEAPFIAHWDVSSCLLPAHETSGDFYDFIPLGDRKWGLVVADVTDKGMGAALFMALSSSLVRTYAVRYPTLPAITLSAVSERILTDTRGSMFVTTFFGVLEPHTGRLMYANAGHPPGILIQTSRRGKESIERLRPTGMALGVSEDARWKQREVRLNPGDVLVLYTDGITEAESAGGIFFGEDRLIEAVLGAQHQSARGIQDALLAEIAAFTNNAHRQDDIALIVLKRNA